VDDARQVGVADQSPESVGTKKEDVTFFEGHGEIRSVRNDIASGAEGRGKNVALRVRLGVFGANDAALDQAADVRMIAGEAGDGFSANQVEAAIADMGEMELAADDGERGACGSHAVELWMLLGKTLNVLMRRFERCGERGLRVTVKGVVIHAANGLDREAAGFLSAFVSTHAVGDHGEAAFAAEVLVGIGLPVEVGIFVVGALETDIGQAGGFDAGLGSFGVNGHR